jgi:solute carrier family 13 (sodium-dependent dicarboxylate transporter), member 2/3/5
MGHRQLSIFLVAVVLWVSEAIPLHATAALIIGAEVVLVSDQAVLGVPGDFEAPSFALFYGALADPVIILFLGGFFLADGAAKFALDRNVARALLRPFGTSPKWVLAGIMAITAVLSMFMSNTATTATMLAVVLPLAGRLPPGDRFATALALGVPVAANVGGIGTPVGTPPNAIALSALTAAGERITFVGWMALAVPFALVVLVLAWLVLLRLFPSSGGEVVLSTETRFDRSRPAMIFTVVATATVVLWLTEPIHGIAANVVAFLPIAALLATGVFTAEDLQGLQWHVLWLVAGGIALGAGVAATGLDDWLVGLVTWEALPLAVLIGALVALALGLSTIISNSATANLLVPVGMTLASSGAVDLSPLLAGVLIAAGCSLAMALPISTPPNAIAYATGMVRTADLAVVGAIVGVAGLLLFAYVAPPLWSMLGLAS